MIRSRRKRHVAWCCGVASWSILLIVGGRGYLAGQEPAGAPRAERPDGSGPPETGGWLTGEQLEQQLALPAGVNWRSLELRSALERLAASQRVAIFLDRRIDPNQRVDFTSVDRPLEETLSRLASERGAAVGLIGSVVYLGPRDEVERMTTMAAKHSQSLREEFAAGGRWRRKEAWTWPALTTPEKLLKDLAAQSQLQLLGTEQLPHDLWPAADLPPLSLSDRFSLVLAGFGLTFAVEDQGRAIRLIPVPENPRLRKSYALPANANSLLTRFRRHARSADIQQEAGRVILEGSWNDHRQLARLLAGRSVAPSSGSPALQRYTLRVENKTVGAVAKALAAQLNRRLEISPAANPALRQMVSFQVQDATLDALLHAVFDPVSLRFEVDEERIRVFREAP